MIICNSVGIHWKDFHTKHSFGDETDRGHYLLPQIQNMVVA